MYSSPNLHKTVRHHFLCNFFQYLQHVEGGSQKQAQALIITRHVHKIMEEIEPKGTGLKTLTQSNSLDIWDKFAGPRLSGKINKGDTLKVYVRSLQLFALFIKKRLFYNPRLISQNTFTAIVGLMDRLPEYRKTIHKRTAVEHTTRKVEESYSAIQPEDAERFYGLDIEFYLSDAPTSGLQSQEPSFRLDPVLASTIKSLTQQKLQEAMSIAIACVCDLKTLFLKMLEKVKLSSLMLMEMIDVLFRPLVYYENMKVLGEQFVKTAIAEGIDTNPADLVSISLGAMKVLQAGEKPNLIYKW